MTAVELVFWYGSGADFFAGRPGATVPRSAVATRHTEMITEYVRALGGGGASR